jgi:hypothetical protein
MPFRKFGHSDEQRVALDREEDELARRTAAASDEAGRWTQEDQEALLRETTEK